MAIPLEKFVRQLEDTGIISGDTLRDYIPPKGSSQDAESLARELVRKKQFTRYQAEEVYRGKGKALVLGNYVLLEKIGAGGMGQVFKAYHRRMDRFVAIKLLPPELTKDQDAIARFSREVKAAAKISHPNIVAAFDADCADKVHFLVMEAEKGSEGSRKGVSRKGVRSHCFRICVLIHSGHAQNQTSLPGGGGVPCAQSSGGAVDDF